MDRPCRSPSRPCLQPSSLPFPYRVIFPAQLSPLPHSPHVAPTSLQVSLAAQAVLRRSLSVPAPLGAHGALVP